MMRFETCDTSPNFYRVRGLRKYSSKYISSIKDKHKYLEDGIWHVHVSQCVCLSQYGYNETGHVDYSQLPDWVQMLIAKEKEGWRRGTTAPIQNSIDNATAYATLYLTSNAPAEVVSAAYKALAKKHHPDKGGDPEAFKRITEAYEKLKKR